MGTRNLTVVQYHNEYKVAQYCQWDGYPSGQGMIFLEFARSIVDHNKRKRFANKVAALEYLTEDKIQKLWESVGATSNWVGMDVSEAFERNWPHLHRNCGANVLNMIKKARKGTVKLNDSIDFAKDGLFCEWLWFLNLDEGVIEAYSGVYGDKKGNNERFENMEKLASWSLANLPSNDDFLNQLGD